MYQTTDASGQTWIVSRVRNGTAELVHAQTGHLVIIHSDDLPPVVFVDLPLINTVPFYLRPKSFLTQLRSLRVGTMFAKVKAKRAADAKRAAKANGTAPSTKRKVNPRLAAAQSKIASVYANLPPDLAAKLMEQLKGQK